MHTMTSRGLSVRTPEQLADMERFEFCSLDDVSQYHWTEIHRRLMGHARKTLAAHGCKTMRADHLAESVVASVRSGRREWNPEVHANLLQYLFMVVRSIVVATASDCQNDPDIAQHCETTRRHRRRGSGILNEIRLAMDVPGVIENLPTIALLVSRLNDLLNPIARPQTSESVAAKEAPAPAADLKGGLL